MMLLSSLRRLREDDGFSVFEVVFASFILFFAITAVLGLVATTTNMGVDAKRRNMMNNAISSRMEEYRSLPFDRIALSPDGDVRASETFTYQGFTVTLSCQVRNGPNGTKEIRMTATTSASGMTPFSTTASTFVRNRDIDFTQSTADPNKPDVSFASGTPADGSVVYSNYVFPGSPAPPLTLIGQASAKPGMVITEMKMTWGGQLLKNSEHAWASSARWTWTPGTDAVQNPAPQSFTWHTLQDGGIIGDGWQQVVLYAEDDQQNKGTLSRRFLVDNLAPLAPASLTASITSNVSARIRWPQSNDGNTGASGYDLDVYNMRSGSMNEADKESFTQLTALNKVLTTNSFSRYVARVRALSPRALASDWTVGSAYVTYPLASAETSVSLYKPGSRTRQTMTTSFTVTPPTFPCSGAVTYVVYRRALGEATYTNMGSYTTSTFTDVLYDPANPANLYIDRGGGSTNSAVQYEYYVEVLFTPTGGTATTLRTNGLGPTPALTRVNPTLFVTSGWQPLASTGW